MSDAQRDPLRLHGDQAKSAHQAPPASEAKTQRDPLRLHSDQAKSAHQAPPASEAETPCSGAGSTHGWTLASPLIVLIQGYQRWISPGRPPTCRFYPSCSEYAVESLRTHGLFEGSALAIWRLLRCAPWHPGGVDPVPPRRPRVDRRTDDSATEERGPC